MNDTQVTLGALGIIGTAVAAFIWVIKFLMTELKTSIDKNSKSHDKVAKATQINTQVSKETLSFMKNLNGKLAKITRQTIQEQNIAHQTVHKVDSDET